MTLQRLLDEFRAEFLAKFPADKAAIMQCAAEQLERELQTRQFLQVGDIAPDFILPNAIGKAVRLHDRLAQGAIILSFYRGGWCPYCNLELRAYQQVLPQIRSLGASLIAIAPQTPDASLTTVEKNNLGFEVLSDAGAQVAIDYRLAFQIPDDLKRLYTDLGHPLPQFNGTEDWQLPIPATFVIDQTERIALAHIDLDYRNRLEPSEAIAVLHHLSQQAA